MSLHHRAPRGFRRGPRVADQLTRDHLSFIGSSFAAERAGDAESALEFHRGVPAFRRSAHAVLLTQLAGLSEEMTPWLWARWAAYQCTRAEEMKTETGRRQRSALTYAVETFHYDRLQRAAEAGADPVPMIGRVAGEDWCFHQLCTHELGGLESFLDELATGQLAREAGWARSWLGARMGGYRLEPGPGLWVRDLATDEPLELLDLGARVHAAEDGWLMGRLVPSGVTPSLMFDTRPVAVDEQTAREVATTTGRGGWVNALVAAIDAERVDPAVLESEDRELVTDVPSLDLVRVGTRPVERARVMQQLREGRDEVGRAAFRILRSALHDTLGGEDMAPYVGAAVLDAHAYGEAQRLLVEPGQGPIWSRWAGLVTQPARRRLERFAMAATAA